MAFLNHGTRATAPFVNGGIYLRHSVIGEFATEIRCFLRRLVCRNGMVAHICLNGNGSHVRTRRLRADHDHRDAMTQQLERVATMAWAQLDEKLARLRDLLHQPPADESIFTRLRSRLSLNRVMVQAIGDAMAEDEMQPTNSFYDFVTALSRVATHSDHRLLTGRQRRTLMRASGELSLHHMRRCNSCGTWLEAASQN